MSEKEKNSKRDGPNPSTMPSRDAIISRVQQVQACIHDANVAMDEIYISSERVNTEKYLRLQKILTDLKRSEKSLKEMLSAYDSRENDDLSMFGACSLEHPHYAEKVYIGKKLVQTNKCIRDIEKEQEAHLMERKTALEIEISRAKNAYIYNKGITTNGHEFRLQNFRDSKPHSFPTNRENEESMRRLDEKEEELDRISKELTSLRESQEKSEIGSTEEDDLSIQNDSGSKKGWTGEEFAQPKTPTFVPDYLMNGRENGQYKPSDSESREAFNKEIIAKLEELKSMREKYVEFNDRVNGSSSSMSESRSRSLQSLSHPNQQHLGPMTQTGENNQRYDKQGSASSATSSFTNIPINKAKIPANVSTNKKISGHSSPFGLGSVRPIVPYLTQIPRKNVYGRESSQSEEKVDGMNLPTQPDVVDEIEDLEISFYELDRTRQAEAKNQQQYTSYDSFHPPDSEQNKRLDGEENFYNKFSNSAQAETPLENARGAYVTVGFDRAQPAPRRVSSAPWNREFVDNERTRPLSSGRAQFQDEKMDYSYFHPENQDRVRGNGMRHGQEYYHQQKEELSLQLYKEMSSSLNILSENMKKSVNLILNQKLQLELLTDGMMKVNERMARLEYHLSPVENAQNLGNDRVRGDNRGSPNHGAKPYSTRYHDSGANTAGHYLFDNGDIPENQFAQKFQRDQSKSSPRQNYQNPSFRQRDWTDSNSGFTPFGYPSEQAELSQLRIRYSEGIGEHVRTTVPQSRSGQFAPPASASASNNSMLNNQVPPGTRANNYYDNFRSYSRQNMLSSPKSNGQQQQQQQHHQPEQRPMPPQDESNIFLQFDNTNNFNNPDQNARSAKNPSSNGANKALWTNTFVENIGGPPKRRNKDQKSQPSTSAQRSNSASSVNSSQAENIPLASVNAFFQQNSSFSNFPSTSTAGASKQNQDENSESNVEDLSSKMLGQSDRSGTTLFELFEKLSLLQNSALRERTMGAIKEILNNIDGANEEGDASRATISQVAANLNEAFGELIPQLSSSDMLISEIASSLSMSEGKCQSGHSLQSQSLPQSQNSAKGDGLLSELGANSSSMINLDENSSVLVELGGSSSTLMSPEMRSSHSDQFASAGHSNAVPGPYPRDMMAGAGNGFGKSKKSWDSLGQCPSTLDNGPTQKGFVIYTRAPVSRDSENNISQVAEQGSPAHNHSSDSDYTPCPRGCKCQQCVPSHRAQVRSRMRVTPNAERRVSGTNERAVRMERAEENNVQCEATEAPRMMRVGSEPRMAGTNERVDRMERPEDRDTEEIEDVELPRAASGVSRRRVSGGNQRAVRVEQVEDSDSDDYDAPRIMRVESIIRRCTDETIERVNAKRSEDNGRN